MTAADTAIMKSALIAVAVLVSGCSEIVLDLPDSAVPTSDAYLETDASPEDAGLPTDAEPRPDAWEFVPDAGREVDSGSSPDTGPVPTDAGSDDGGPIDSGSAPDAATWDAGEDAGPTPPPDSGPPDAGPPDAGPPDSGPPDSGPPDAGPPDSGPPPCLLDYWEPNDVAATAAVIGTTSRPTWVANIEPTFSGADSDWFRVDMTGDTTRPMRVRAQTPPTLEAWLRVRFVCADGSPATCSASPVNDACERTGYPIGAAELTASCSSGTASVYVEATRPTTTACAYSLTISIGPS